MTAEDDRRDKIWSRLYRQLVDFFEHYGAEDACGRGDFWVVDDNYGWRRHFVYLFNLDLLTPSITKAVQRFLDDYPGWDIVFVVDVVGKEKEWPPMGVTIRKHEIIDGLQRQYLPARFQDFKIPGSRLGTGYD